MVPESKECYLPGQKSQVGQSAFRLLPGWASTSYSSNGPLHLFCSAVFVVPINTLSIPRTALRRLRACRKLINKSYGDPHFRGICKLHASGRSTIIREGTFQQFTKAQWDPKSFYKGNVATYPAAFLELKQGSTLSKRVTVTCGIR